MSNTYQIATLADIYALPGIDAIDRCMAEMCSALKEIKELEQLTGTPIALEFPWDWTDDGIKDCSVQINDENGNHAFTFEVAGR